MSIIDRARLSLQALRHPERFRALIDGAVAGPPMGAGRPMYLIPHTTLRVYRTVTRSELEAKLLAGSLDTRIFAVVAEVSVVIE